MRFRRSQGADVRRQLPQMQLRSRGRPIAMLVERVAPESEAALPRAVQLSIEKVEKDHADKARPDPRECAVAVTESVRS
jgi:hypothetical protein